MTATSTAAFIPVAEPFLGDHELEYVTDAVRSGWISSIGQYVARFEEDLQAAVQAKHALAVSNGTAALHLALATLNLAAGDEVIVPSYTFVASAAAVRYVGAIPVFADADPTHWCLDTAELERLLTPRTRAVLPVHVYGHPCDMDAIAEFADKHGLVVIEDAAEALGASCRGRKVGALGDIGALSFYGNKLITTGEGGALLTNNDALAERARLLRDHAMHPSKRYWHAEIGFNYRLTNIQAAIGVAQLERLDDLLQRKIRIADRYLEGLEGIPGLQPQGQAPWAKSAWWMFTTLVLPEFGIDRDALAAELRSEQIDSRPAFVSLHELPPFSNDRPLPVAEKVGRYGLTLPSGVTLTDDEQDRVIAAVRAACRA